MAKVTMILEEGGKVVHEVKVEPVDARELKRSGYIEKGSKPEVKEPVEVKKRGRKPKDTNASQADSV